MDITALQVFLAVADTGSFSRAAERVFLTQPAISRRIAPRSEAQLGTRLFDRIGRTIQLTPAGQGLRGPRRQAAARAGRHPALARRPGRPG
ncbi:MAG: LysR family transcriptional regulator [Comamonadaceae bacterium]|nr:LysR family transcriptional regulator [Comamonadaceae bacterium]